MAIPIQVGKSEASRSTEPARHAPATQPHTRLSAALGAAAASTGLGLLVALHFDSDQRAGERLFAVAVLGGLLGLGYLATRLRLREQIQATRVGYWLGRRVERAVARRHGVE